MPDELPSWWARLKGTEGTKFPIPYGIAAILSPLVLALAVPGQLSFAATLFYGLMPVILATALHEFIHYLVARVTKGVYKSRFSMEGPTPVVAAYFAQGTPNATWKALGISSMPLLFNIAGFLISWAMIPFAQSVNPVFGFSTAMFAAGNAFILALSLIGDIPTTFRLLFSESYRRDFQSKVDKGELMAPEDMSIDAEDFARRLEYEETETIDISQEDAVIMPQIVSAVKEGRMLILDLSHMPQEVSVENYKELASKFLHIAIEINDNFPEGDNSWIGQITELLKNAFCHGNNLNYKLPVLLRVTLTGEEDIGKIEVYDTAMPGRASRKAGSTAKKARIMGDKIGAKTALGLTGREFAYDRKSISDREGRIIATLAQVEEIIPTPAPAAPEVPAAPAEPIAGNKVRVNGEDYYLQVIRDRSEMIGEIQKWIKSSHGSTIRDAVWGKTFEGRGALAIKLVAEDGAKAGETIGLACLRIEDRFMLHEKEGPRPVYIMETIEIAQDDQGRKLGTVLAVKAMEEFLNSQAVEEGLIDHMVVQVSDVDPETADTKPDKLKENEETLLNFYKKLHFKRVAYGSYKYWVGISKENIKQNLPKLYQAEYATEPVDAPVYAEQPELPLGVAPAAPETISAEPEALPEGVKAAIDIEETGRVLITPENKEAIIPAKLARMKEASSESAVTALRESMKELGGKQGSIINIEVDEALSGMKDDLALLAPLRNGMSAMRRSADEYVRSYDLGVRIVNIYVGSPKAREKLADKIHTQMAEKGITDDKEIRERVVTFTFAEKDSPEARAIENVSFTTYLRPMVETGKDKGLATLTPVDKCLTAGIRVLDVFERMRLGQEQKYINQYTEKALQSIVEISGSVDPKELEKLIKEAKRQGGLKHLSGLIFVKIRPVNWQDIVTLHEAMSEVLQAL